MTITHGLVNLVKNMSLYLKVKKYDKYYSQRQEQGDFLVKTRGPYTVLHKCYCLISMFFNSFFFFSSKCVGMN